MAKMMMRKSPSYNTASSQQASTSILDTSNHGICHNSMSVLEQFKQPWSGTRKAPNQNQEEDQEKKRLTKQQKQDRQQHRDQLKPSLKLIAQAARKFHWRASSRRKKESQRRARQLCQLLTARATQLDPTSQCSFRTGPAIPMQDYDTRHKQGPFSQPEEI